MPIRWRSVFTLLASALFANQTSAHAATITADGSTCTLADAILSANANSDTGGCTHTDAYGADTIVLDYDATLTAPDTANSTLLDGTYAGLPEVASDLTIEAGAGRVIQRDPAYGCSASDAHSFRLLNVTGEGGASLTLVGIELRHGCAAPGDASSADSAGGAIWAIDGATLSATDCVFEDNQAWGSGLGDFARGGAIFLEDSPSFGSTASFTDTRFLGNRANGRSENGTSGSAEGGALYLGAGGEASFTGCELVGNAAAGGDGPNGGQATGGAIAFGPGTGSDLTSLAGCTFRDNRASGGDGIAGTDAFGGAIGHLFGGGQIGSLTSSIFEGNVAEGGDGATSGGLGTGGAVACIVQCTLTELSDVLFRGNQALGGAGGSAAGGDAGGGAVVVNDVVSADSVTFADNEARAGAGADGGQAAGGALDVPSGGANLLSNLTATGNLAQGGDSSASGTGGDADGGALFLDPVGTAVRSATVVGNRAVSGSGTGGDGSAAGGGLFVASGSPTIAFLAAAGNSVRQGGGAASPSDCDTDTSVVTGGGNVIEAAGACGTDLTDPTDLLGVDPLVGPLGDYGCVVPLPDGSCLPTMELDLASTAIDRGDCAGLGIRDARGFLRGTNVPFGAGTGECDSGAYEQQNVYFVDASATAGANDGTSWADACLSLRDALDGTCQGGPPVSPSASVSIGQEWGELWIAGGVYRPDDGANATADDPAETFTLPNATSLYGGFAGGETSLVGRDPVAHPTVLSGDIDENDLVDADGITTDWVRINGTNAYHLLTASNAAVSTPILDGLVLTGASATGVASGDKLGADLVCPFGGAATLRHVRVIGNEMTSRATIFGCDVEVSDSSFENNLSFDVAAVMAGNDTRFVRTRFTGNRSSIQGALFYLSNSPLRLVDSVVIANHTGPVAGTIRTQGPLELTNVVFSGNDNNGSGAVLGATAAADVTLTNVTVSGNRATTAGVIDFQSTGRLAIRNSILWDNRTGSTSGSLEASITAGGSATVEIRNSIVQGSGGSASWSPAWIDGGGNLDVDPLFVTGIDPVDAPTFDGDLRLRLASPAIDAGDDSVVVTATDLDGDARITGAAVDLGPWERPGELFSDGFESGDTTRWSVTVTP